MKFDLVAFDLDGTLARSKSSMSPKMVEVFSELIKTVDTCIISGGKLEQFVNQALALFPKNTDFTKLHLMPTCGTRYYKWVNNDWQEQYKNDFTDEEKDRIIESLVRNAKDLGLWEENTKGDIIEDRGSQITFSALGQMANVDDKEAWDPDNSKKEKLRAAVNKELPEFQVGSGGSTSIDITQIGVDKAYGLERLSERTGLDINEFLFIGDRLEEGGNDFPVKRLGIQTVHVSSPEETVGVIEGILL